MNFNKTIWVALICCLFAAQQSASAQCASCSITLPAGIPADTIYLDSFANARKNVPYNQQASFRFPYTTTPLAAIAPGTPSGIPLTGFTITGVNGLPLGLSWIGDQPLPMVYAQNSPQTRDGCIRVCGTPQQSGLFTVNVSIVVTAFGQTQNSNIPVRFLVLPDTSSTFSMDTTRGCDSLRVTFTNRVTETPPATYEYLWNFGNGQTSTLRNPAMPINYTTIDTFPVSLRAISTLAIPRTFLSSVTVTNVSCTDPFNAVDLFLTIQTAGGVVDSVTSYVGNTAPPIIWNFAQDIILNRDSSYSIFVQDDDAISNGIPGPANCGTVTFRADTTANRFTLTNGGLTATVALGRDTLYDKDTLLTEDFVVVTSCNPVSVEQALDSEVSYKVYPNPTNDLVNIEFELKNTFSEDLQVTVYDALGRAVHQEILSGSQTLHNRQVSMGEYGAGVYTIQVRAGREQWTRRVIVQP